MSEQSTEQVEPDPPVYDERGNVRPRGTPGAVPMTYAERVRIAKRIAKGEQILAAIEQPALVEDQDDETPDQPEVSARPSAGRATTQEKA